MTRYAEVIGDPVSHSLSPAIHRHWLRALGIDGRFGTARVTPETFSTDLAERCKDPDWAGWSITAPLKQAAVMLVKADGAARATGAVNCIHRGTRCLEGTNTDIEGLAAALDHISLRKERVAVIGAGGAARALLTYLARRKVDETILVSRNPTALAGRTMKLTEPDFRDVRLIVNATPLGLAGGAPMPAAVLDALPSGGATVMDMVYSPLETPLLAAARARGLEAIDGLHMLIGQARRAFRLFFGADPPASDAALRALLSEPR